MASGEADKVIPVRVAVRVRPLVEREIKSGCQEVVKVIDGQPQIHVTTTDKSWTYDYALPGHSDNLELYNKSVKDIMKNLYKGYNVTVLAYGQTGSGKTHSMGTAYNSNCNEEMEGVIPRAVRDIFVHITEDGDNIDYNVKISFLELYNEQLFDLLSTKSRREETMVDIREDGKGGIKIPGLTEAPISSMKETMILLEKASMSRVTAATAMNQTSSRSHAIFTLILESRSKGGNVNSDTGSAMSGVTVAKFHLVDLAGSERAKKTMAKGDRLKEGININMGLLALGNVISALGEENRSGSHIPYRDSKLTRLLQDSLGGNSHTLMIACVSPADTNLEETVSTLRYADRARKIKNKPIVNKDPASAELNRLRSQVQQLQMELINGKGSGGLNSSVGQVANDKTLADNLRLKEENEKLTCALLAAMEENTHMSEKLLLSEQNSEKMHQVLKDLENQVDVTDISMNQTSDTEKTFVEVLRSKVSQVLDCHKKAERSIMDHDIERNALPEETDDDDNDEDTEEETEGQTARAVFRQTELAGQLVELNKALTAKQELANKAGVNDDKLKKYEETVRNMEVEITKLQQEKDDLNCQVQRVGGEANNKVSEMRRKKIQELELKIAGLKKQQLEHQRLAKLNSQNAAKVTRYQDDIKQMKGAKVKLIKSMKEESERVRVWKAKKEKEVVQLKQADRKAKVAISKMTQMHQRRENVLKRKMEETTAINKRLKDVMAKKEFVRSQKTSAGGLEGAGERVRGLVKNEVDLVVVVKEAEVNKNQLVRERKTFAQDLSKIKQDMRMTLTSAERDELTARQTELQKGLDMRNAQIAELQKQIISAGQEKEKTDDRWAKLNSLVETKLAIQYLFDTATVNMAQAANRGRELEDLATQLEDLRESKTGTMTEMSKLRARHEDEVVRMEREHEEKILFLLRQLPGQEQPETRDVSLGDNISEVESRLAFQAEELAKMSDIHDKLLQRDRELEKLKVEMGSRRSLMPEVFQPKSPKKSISKMSRRVTIAPVERYKAEEFFEEHFSSEDSTSESEEEDSDPDWRKTPMFDRIKKARRSLGCPGTSMQKRKRLDNNEEESEDGDGDNEEEERQVNKRKGSIQRCTCKSGCKTKMCSCRKVGPYCTSLCGCPANKCAHREVPGADVSSAVDTDKENEMEDNNDDTNKLLDSTFDVAAPKLKITPARKALGDTNGPIFKTPSSADMFAMDSDGDTTPINRAESLFTTPKVPKMG